MFRHGFKLVPGTLHWALLLAVAVARPGSAAEGEDFFEKKIRPLLVEHCYECHSAGSKKLKGGLRLDTREGVLKGGESGPVLVPGEPERSRLIESVRYKNRDLQMPPKTRLSTAQVADLEKWVKLGAPDPRTEFTLKPARKLGMSFDEGRQFWAYQPVANPLLPAVKNTRWVQTPVDRFILAKLEANQLKPAAAADKRVLLRRVFVGVIGLLPSPEEVDSFVRDTSPDAFEKVVDRLLASPHYGERWGRHWLDVVRYADSNGMDENAAHANAWRYRDYVVDSFNRDKPFDGFLIEQVAGDLLVNAPAPATPHERLIATGFLSLGPKVLAEADKVKMEMDIIDEQVDTLGRALMGVTFGCARCHDHKFDPVTAADYYALAGIFKSTKTMLSLTTIAKWNEHPVANAAELAAKEIHDKKIAAHKEEIRTFTERANQLLLADKQLKELPKSPETSYPTNTLAKLKELRAALVGLEKAAPPLPSAMGVAEQSATNLPVHIRGNYLTLGPTVSRGVPRVFPNAASPIPENQSGRLELARWIASKDNPLTARVFVNRVWNWHFGEGLVRTTDNFGALGERPTHPELLDWLASRFVAEGWSVKKLHRHILLSSTYQMGPDAEGRATARDPDNRFWSRWSPQRMDAESIRDSLLQVSHQLDRTLGGTLFEHPNYQLVFDHTSTDKTTYNTVRRSLYLPVIRNHLCDTLELFDFPDPNMMNGHRVSTTIPTQALYSMNSELVLNAAQALAADLARLQPDETLRMGLLYSRSFGRPPTAKESRQAANFLDRFAQVTGGSDPAAARRAAWEALCQSIVTSNEFMFLR
ncbi:MAG: DUF1553 domain-containing protein [Pedosphaera sp.]|nr:DUF1553 domain-containing protein [Pedosphaera sp.]